MPNLNFVDIYTYFDSSTVYHKWLFYQTADAIAKLFPYFFHYVAMTTKHRHSTRNPKTPQIVLVMKIRIWCNPLKIRLEAIASRNDFDNNKTVLESLSFPSQPRFHTAPSVEAKLHDKNIHPYQIKQSYIFKDPNRHITPLRYIDKG